MRRFSLNHEKFLSHEKVLSHKKVLSTTQRRAKSSKPGTRKQLLPVYFSTLLVPFLCPDPCDLLRCWLRHAMHNLDTQTKLLLCPLPAPALVTGVYPQVREARKALAAGL